MRLFVSLVDVEHLDNNQVITIVTDANEWNPNDRFTNVLLERPLGYEDAAHLYSLRVYLLLMASL